MNQWSSQQTSNYDRDNANFGPTMHIDCCKACNWKWSCFTEGVRLGAELVETAARSIVFTLCAGVASFLDCEKTKHFLGCFSYACGAKGSPSGANAHFGSAGSVES
jgi:hypothetical protein